MPPLHGQEDATRDKIGEAKYFLWMTKERRDAYLSGQGENELCLKLFKYSLSAFLSSARSILDYMRMQYKLDGESAHKKFYDGYMQKGGKFRELKFFNDVRTENVHYKYGNKEPYKVMQRDQCIIPLVCNLMLEASVVEEPASKPLLEQSDPNPQPSIKETLQPSRVPMELLFQKHEGFLDQDTEVIEFCTRQLNTMIGLVELCEKGNFTVEQLDLFA